MDFIPLSTKIGRIVVPKFQLQEGTLMEAIDLLRLRASENDTFETDQAKKGLNIAVNLGDPKVSPGKDILAKTFDLNVSNVPVATLLKYITDITRTSFKVDDFAVTITPAGMYSDELISRTYRVPPDFLSNLTAGSTAEEQPVDIFNTEIGNGGLLAERKGVEHPLFSIRAQIPCG
jgi:general secretion pathway protein D